MNKLLNGIRQAIQTQHVTAAQKYWSLIGDTEASPHEVLSLARELGKKDDDIERDLQLLSELAATPKPDREAVEKSNAKKLAKALKLYSEADRLAAEASLKKSDGDTIKREAVAAKASLDAQERGYKSLLRRLSDAGHPEFERKVLELEEARQQQRQDKVKAVEAKRLEGLLYDAKQSLEAYRDRVRHREADENIQKELSIREGAVAKLEQELEALG